METTDFLFMKEALIEAQNGFEIGEVPVGAVLVYQNQIIARSFNRVESLMDATAHAEMRCVRQGSEILENWRLSGCTLYTTLEPCPMCAGALISSRVDRVVWGASDLRQGAGGSLINLLGQNHPIHTVQTSFGVLAQESALLMQSFFQGRRKWKKSLIN
ncbi:MAG: tRNA adenosine(34) deaminase TadA [Rhabdochlamydiaceae bacterium]